MQAGSLEPAHTLDLLAGSEDPAYVRLLLNRHPDRPEGVEMHAGAERDVRLVGADDAGETARATIRKGSTNAATRDEERRVNCGQTKFHETAEKSPSPKR